MSGPHSHTPRDSHSTQSSTAVSRRLWKSNTSLRCESADLLDKFWRLLSLGNMEQRLSETKAINCRAPYSSRSSLSWPQHTHTQTLTCKHSLQSATKQYWPNHVPGPVWPAYSLGEPTGGPREASSKFFEAIELLSANDRAPGNGAVPVRGRRWLMPDCFRFLVGRALVTVGPATTKTRPGRQSDGSAG